jgi:hypothetical protein
LSSTVQSLAHLSSSCGKSDPHIYIVRDPD